MYQPPHFRVEDRPALLDVIRAHPLGLLITSGENGLMANPIPFVLVGEGEVVRLRAHLARPNPQWRDMQGGAEALVVFQGPEHYISPSWYATKAETHRVVPTWNYVMVQVRGPAHVDESADFLRPQIKALTTQQETGRAQPWGVEDAPEAFIAAQMRGIVGIEIEIKEMIGKFKLSQNRNAADQAGVITGLQQDGDAAALAMAARMEAQP